MTRQALGAGICLMIALAASARGEGPVDATAPLQELSTKFGLCDGPSWDGRIWFVPDVKGTTLYSYDPASQELEKLVENARISATYFRHGKLYCSDNGAACISVLQGRELSKLAVLDASEKPVNRPNDLVVDQAGGVYVTLTKPNQVAYITPGGEVTTAIAAVETPNGITLSPDEKMLYVSAYIPKEVWAYDVTGPGKTGPGRKLAVMDDGKDPGADGMAIDSAGNIYCAGAKSVWIWDPSGKLLTKLETPTRPINCAFGDKDLKSLYITCFGGLYKQRMTVTGLAPDR
jgi:gluconolactonase